MLGKEILVKEVCPSTIQEIEVDKSIQFSRENSEVWSEANSDRMDGNKDVIGNLKHIQDAFVFCPIMGSIQMDNIVAQGIFLREKELSQMVDTKFSLFNTFTSITFDERD